MVGPLPRVHLNRHQLSAGAKKAVAAVGLDLDSTDPFDNVRARVVETVHAIDESINIIKKVGLDVAEQPVRAHIGMPCEGAALTEAPRGLLYHGYRFDRSGVVTHADIVPPTAHNSAHVEDMLRALSPGIVKADGDLTFECEKLVRAYDPCISCSVHTTVVKPGGR
jgi:coenzyme F420-reducing hydrogenase alpha subunit